MHFEHLLMPNLEILFKYFDMLLVRMQKDTSQARNAYLRNGSLNSLSEVRLCDL